MAQGGDEDIQKLLEQMHLKEKAEAVKKKHTFWESQPVKQFKEEGDPSTVEEGPVNAESDVSKVRQEPYGLPAGYEWVDCDISNQKSVEEVYTLLSENYVEDDDNMFRFNYSSAFLEWALQPPGFKSFWHTGVRVAKSQKLVAFISAIPAKIRVGPAKGNVQSLHEGISMVEINFLCVHKKLRTKRLAPVLIKEITRRVNLFDIWQASYTAGVIIPTPVATCRYFHRSLDPKKLIEVGFSKLAKRMTLSRTIKLHKLPETPGTKGLRPMKKEDAPQVLKLLNSYLSGFDLACIFQGVEDVEHWFLPREGVIYTYVVDSGNKKKGITDIMSFYSLPSTIIGNEKHKELKAAFSYINIAKTVDLKSLMEDALVNARNEGFDVFNALDIMHNLEVLKDLKFGIGDGHLQYYLYNWKMKNAIAPSKVGLVLL
jgi:glycylpeptide N-tetradecanoyltransferase